jgi:rhodanese-related sulfurtransferase
MPIERVSPEEAHRAFTAGGVQLVDVREVIECDAERVEGALNLPLSRFDELSKQVRRGEPVYLLCRSGGRAADAAKRLQGAGHERVLIVEGGLNAWAASGKPVVKGVPRAWAMDRQVRFVAGSLVTAGFLLAWLVDARFLVLSALVGVALAVTAALDVCPMATLLGRMPWNRGSCR